MRIGAVFPQTEIGTSAPAIRAYAHAVEAMGYTHILAYDHIIGAGTTTRPDWNGPYTSESPFHEVFVLFGYLAAVTERIELVTGVLVLPRRQTALVAKQAAEVDVLSGGRLRDRPRRLPGNRSAGMASTVSSSSRESCTFAAEMVTAGGRPWRLTTMCAWSPTWHDSSGPCPSVRPLGSRHARAIERRPPPVDAARVLQALQEQAVQPLPDPDVLPVA